MSTYKGEFTVERTRIETGRSFSPDAMTDLAMEMQTWIGEHVIAQWQRTKVPPTRLVVRVEMEVQ